MRRTYFLLFTCLTAGMAFYFLLSVFAFAQEIPVNIKADKLKFCEESGLVEAQGSVEVNFEEVTIYADHLRMDSVSNVATAEGRVRLSTKDYWANANRLVYDAGRKVSTFSDFKAELSPQNIRGKLYLRTGELRDLKDKMLGGRGSVTTCDYAIPHYFLSADKVEYYPNDRVEGRGVTLYVGEVAVLWMPYLRYDLKQKRKKNWVFGHNEVEGDYLKTAWDYPGGLLLLDYMEKKGWGYGTEVGYGLAALGLGTLYLYHQPEKDTGIPNWVTRIDHQKQLNPLTTLKLNHRYTSTYLIPSGRIEQTALGLNLRHAGSSLWNLKLDTLDDRIAKFQRYALQLDQSSGGISTNYYYNYDFGKSDPGWLRKSQRFYHRRPLWSDKINFSTTTTYYHYVPRAGDPGEEKIEPLIELTGRESDFSWRYTENWFVDLRSSLSPGIPRYEFLEKQPEIEIYPRSVDLKLFNLQSTLGYGRYREVKQLPALGAKRDFTTERYRATLNAGRSMALGVGTVLTLGAGLDQYSYAPGDQLYAFRENASLTTNLRNFFRNEINFRQGYTEGNTPFFFDQLGTRYHDIREKMTFYYLNKFSWSIEGGHNWLSNKYFDVMTHLLAAPEERVQLTIDTGWDIENQRYKDLVANLRLAPYSFLAVGLAMTQDLNGAGLKYGSALYDIYFLEGAPNQIYLRLSQVFDPATKEFKVRDIMVVKNLHCWEMKYTYNESRKEFSFVFTLKAIPEEPVGFAPGRGFYFEGFERELKEFKKEGEIRRY